MFIFCHGNKILQIIKLSEERVYFSFRGSNPWSGGPMTLRLVMSDEAVHPDKSAWWSKTVLFTSPEVKGAESHGPLQEYSYIRCHLLKVSLLPAASPRDQLSNTWTFSKSCRSTLMQVTIIHQLFMDH